LELFHAAKNSAAQEAFAGFFRPWAAIWNKEFLKIVSLFDKRDFCKEFLAKR